MRWVLSGGSVSDARERDVDGPAECLAAIGIERESIYDYGADEQHDLPGADPDGDAAKCNAERESMDLAN
jgi:hypothetical protein